MSAKKDKRGEKKEEEEGLEIIIERDYSRGVLTQFKDILPPELSSRVTEEEFSRTIGEINRLFRHAEELTVTSCLESCFGLITLFSLYLCITDRYTESLQRLEAFLEDENNNVYRPKGLVWLNPLSNGLLYIQILDINSKQQA
ncbi:hypothetical protein QOT17_001273 [Balamuthia mandrillaris]